jgi:hypothetical protein
MTMPTHTRAFCWLAGVVAAALSASAASAEIFPPSTIAGVYQQSTSTRSTSPPADTGCANTTGCDFVFSRVPSGKQLVVSNVSCSVASSAGFISLMQLVAQRPNGEILARAQNLQPVKTEGVQYFLNNTTLAAFDSRERPLVRIHVSTFTNISGLCTIAGQLSDAPP